MTLSRCEYSQSIVTSNYNIHIEIIFYIKMVSYVVDWVHLYITKIVTHSIEQYDADVESKNKKEVTFLVGEEDQKESEDRNYREMLE